MDTGCNAVSGLAARTGSCPLAGLTGCGGLTTPGAQHGKICRRQKCFSSTKKKAMKYYQFLFFLPENRVFSYPESPHMDSSRLFPHDFRGWAWLGLSVYRSEAALDLVRAEWSLIGRKLSRDLDTGLSLVAPALTPALVTRLLVVAVTGASSD